MGIRIPELVKLPVDINQKITRRKIRYFIILLSCYLVCLLLLQIPKELSKPEKRPSIYVCPSGL